MLSSLDLLIITGVKSAINYIFTVKGFMLFAIIGGFGSQLISPISNIIKGEPNGNLQKRKR